MTYPTTVFVTIDEPVLKYHIIDIVYSMDFNKYVI